MAELVGILNITPDSFSDGGEHEGVDAARAHAEQLFADGAALVDVGAESTRPGAEPLTADQEWERLAPFLGDTAVQGMALSIDTYHPANIHRAADLLPRGFVANDITAFRNPAMREAVAEHGLRLVLSHIPEAADSAQAAHVGAKIDSVYQVEDEVRTAIARLVEDGVDPAMIIVDPGIGFGKTADLNWALLAFADYVPDHDVMIGYSRKKFLGEGRMELAINLHAADLAVEEGARYLRVHDVKGHADHLNGY